MKTQENAESTKIARQQRPNMLLVYQKQPGVRYHRGIFFSIFSPTRQRPHTYLLQSTIAATTADYDGDDNDDDGGKRTEWK